MKKYIFVGGLVGFLLGLNSIMVWIGWELTYFISWSFIIDKLTNLIGGDMGIWIGILWIFLLPVIIYWILGYIIGHFLKRK